MEVETQTTPQQNDQRIPIFQRYPYPYEVQQGVYSPPNSFYTEVPVTDEDAAVMGTVIGKNGFYFKAITAAARVTYIWYQKDRKVIEVWGPERRLPNAIARIQRRLETVRAKQQLASSGVPQEVSME